MTFRGFRDSWVKRMVAGLMAAIFLPLSGPIFFCKCQGQMVTLSGLKPPEECCAIHCEPEPEETEDCCSEEPELPCDEEVELAFATPDRAGGQLDVSAHLPLEVTIPGDINPNLALLPVFDLHFGERDVHPPPGSGRLHLHFQILLI